jgi:cyclopropane-fatty-acyl-phospholipid synthase
VAALLARAARQPCPTLLAAARIRMQGVKLYLRGLPVVPRSAASAMPDTAHASDTTVTPETAGTCDTAVAPTRGRLRQPVAAYLAQVYRAITGEPAPPIGLRAWDGSHHGSDGPPTLVLSSPRALRRLVWAPNELGLAQAYVTGELDVRGDVADGLRRIRAGAAADARSPRIATPRNAARLVTAAIRLGAVGPRPAAPASQARVHGGLHTLSRDRAVISHHYDLSNEFYALLLDESMAYSSAYWSSEEPGYTLAEAQRDKYDLICRKLELAPGMRLLDVGCGWGGLLMHAAEHYGIHGLGLTLSRQQAAFIAQRLVQRGIEDRIEVRVQHFREFAEPRAFDAAASIEMGEHVGAVAYPAYTRMVHTSLKPGGRALIQQMSRARTAAPGGGPFIESFIAPDMVMRPLEETVDQWRGTGFALGDTESLREHYVRTVGAWRQALEDAWPKAVELIGEERSRVWRLYLAGGQVAFEQGRMGVDQILLQKATDGGY